ncbi:MAG: radical SAM protein [Candidatus Bathyarchaeota archaeon]
MVRVKVTLVNPSPNIGLDERESRKAVASFPPLGILYLVSALKEKGFEVSVLDQPAKGFTIEETVNWICKEDPDMLGFSTFATSGRTAALISREIKKRNPNIVVVFGNHYATFNAERVLTKYPSVDVIVRGEGELIIIDLVNYITGKGNLKEIDGISFRNKNKIVSTPDRPLIKDLDSIPFPDRSSVDKNYHCIMAGANVAPKKFTSILSSRGCLYRCRFCSCSQFARGRWRPRSIQNTIDELNLIASEGYEQFIFIDDSFTLNQKRVIKLCRKMRKEKLDMEWVCEGRVDNCSIEMLYELRKAGCKVLYFGIESANQRVLDYLNKQTTPVQSRRAVKKARKAGIDILVGSFVMGAPDEKRKEIHNTIKFASQIPIDIPQFNILGVYPGTDLWDEMWKKGYLKGEDYWETGIAISQFYPGTVPFHEIRQMIHDAFYKFIRRPSFIFKQMARTLKSPYRMEIAINNVSRIDDIRTNLSSVA